MSQEKVDYLQLLIIENNFIVQNVERSSAAMGHVAKWVLGIIQQRKLQIEMEPFINQAAIR
jgi:hypothetical protein